MKISSSDLSEVLDPLPFPVGVYRRETGTVFTLAVDVLDAIDNYDDGSRIVELMNVIIDHFEPNNQPGSDEYREVRRSLLKGLTISETDNGETEVHIRALEVVAG